MTALTDLDLEPGIRHWIERITALGADLPDLASLDPAVQRVAARIVSDRIALECTLPIPEGVVLDDLEVDGPGGVLRLRRYRPASLAGAAPTQLWLHGGGFFAGTIDELLNDRLCARRALESGIQILSLEYRLAPEDRYPAQVLDAIAALAAVVAGPERFGVDPDRLGIGGNSAGAAIVASAALRVRDTSTIRLVHLDLEVPPASLPPVGPSAIDYAVGFGLDGVERIVEIYLGADGPADEYASPLDVPDVRGLPRTLVMVAEHDPLRDSGVRFADRLEAAGVPVTLIVGAGHLHGTPGQTAASELARDWQREHSRQLALAYA